MYNTHKWIGMRANERTEPTTESQRERKMENENDELCMKVTALYFKE